MHVISYRRLREYAEKHADIRDALDNWYKIASSMLLFLMEQRDMQSSDLVDVFGSSSLVEDVIAGKVRIDLCLNHWVDYFMSMPLYLFESRSNTARLKSSLVLRSPRRRTGISQPAFADFASQSPTYD